MADGADVMVLHGVAEFRSGLRRIDRDLDRELGRRLRGEVANPVAQRIRGRVPRSDIKSRGRSAAGRRQRKRHWYAVIKPGVTARGVPYITWGRSTVPYAGWVEFGGRIRMPNRGVTLHRPRVRGGRYVYPEIGRARPQAVETTERVLREVSARAGMPIT